MSDRSSTAALLALVAALSGAACSVGPDYVRPDAPVAETWSINEERGLSDDPAELARWWQRLGDPHLDRLVERALAHNVDLDAAIARVRQARAARVGAAAAMLPDIDATGGYSRERSAVGGRDDAGGGGEASGPVEFNRWSAGFDAAWEIDIFGGLRRGVEQAGAELEASQADLRDALVTLLAEVARNYVDVRSMQQRVAIAESNAESQGETLDLTRWRFEAGLATDLDVQQATYSLAQTRSRIPALTSQLVAAGNRVAVLVGEPAGSLGHELAPAVRVPAPPHETGVGAPADLLRRRPDVAAAERRLAAATAAIGVAKADLYPRLAINGAIRVTAQDATDLASPEARAFSVGPTLVWNILDFGRVRSVIAGRSAAADEALAIYESVVLTAGEEAANAMATYANEQIRRDRLSEALAAARQAESLARLEYTNGLTDFQRVLEAQRALLGFEESLAEVTASVTTNLIAIYKALGGGWETVACDGDGCRG